MAGKATLQNTQMTHKSQALAKPFIKWAGGKAQLLGEFEKRYPKELKEGLIRHYYEPFVGSGAVFFDIAQRYRISRFHLFDKNEELILTYLVIQKKLKKLIDILRRFQQKFSKFSDHERGVFYYKIRSAYNKNKSDFNFSKINDDWILRAAQMIFLNRTCFNGLFRLNKKGEFNVPIGRYSNPRILDTENLRRVSEVLQGVEIKVADFGDLKKIAVKKAFVYFDPPYRPISPTASFTSYHNHVFDDDEQIRLACVFRFADKKGWKLMLSNSDPKNTDPKDDFFDSLYSGFSIHRLRAKRLINSVATKRGTITELLITNYSNGD